MAEIDETTLNALSEQAIVALLDEEASREFGEEAAFRILMTLGLSDGDVVVTGGRGTVHLKTSADAIQARLVRALELKKQGWPTHRILVEGLGPLRDRENAVRRLLGAAPGG